MRGEKHGGSPAAPLAYRASMKPTVVVVGRPNVGKSTLFNRLVGRRRALVHDEAGVTRDRLEIDTTWWIRARPLPVKVVDTGGLGGERFADEIEKQATIALAEADIVLMVFDGQHGLTASDRDLMRKFFHSGLTQRAPIIGVVNKVDAEQHETMIDDFYATGLETLITISAEHGRGIEDLQDKVAELLAIEWEEAEAEEVTAAEEADASDRESGDEAATDFDAELDAELNEDADVLPPEPARRTPRVAILGRPNVGKSTLVNALLGKDRMIVSPIAGTTIDSVDSVVEMNGRPYVVVDTAGIRRKSKTEQGVEVLSVVQSRKALESADIVILVIDGSTGATDQDEKIGGLIDEAGCSLILMVNKWDTQKREVGFTTQVAAEAVRKEMGFLKYAPIVFASALENKGLDHLGDLIDDVLEQRRTKVLTKEFTDWVRREATIHNPQNAKFFLAHQTSRHPPTFAIHVNDPERVHFSLRRHLINALRDKWGFAGSPVRMLFLEGKNRKSLPKPSKAKKEKAGRKRAALGG